MKSRLTEIIILHDNNAPVPDFGKTARKSSSDFLAALSKIGSEIRITYANFGSGKSAKPATNEKATPKSKSVPDETAQSSYKITADNIPAGEVRLNARNYTSNGTRDIFDSMGNAMIEKGKAYSQTDQNEHPENVIFVLTAFGRDNASKTFTFNQVSDMIKHQSEVYKWKFFCLANEPAVPGQLGIPEDFVIWIDSENEEFLSKALNELSERIKNLIDTVD